MVHIYKKHPETSSLPLANKPLRQGNFGAGLVRSFEGELSGSKYGIKCSAETGVCIIGPVGIGEVQMTTFFFMEQNLC